MRVVVLGDTHGNTKAGMQAITFTRDHGVKTIMQVGDFGLWTHVENGIKFIDTLNESLRLNGIKMYVVGGNHENWTHWDWHIANGPKDFHGFTYLRSHIRIAPKVHSWVWEGKRCLGIGGAVSIDKDWRLAKEGGNKETLYWPNEQLTDAEVESVPERKVEYMFSHDCSDRTPWKHRLKPDLDSQIHRQRIDKVLSKARPSYHFHGHMHERYDWMNRVSGEEYTQTYGLECDGHWDNMGILDIDTGEFKFRSDLQKDTKSLLVSGFAGDDNF